MLDAKPPCPGLPEQSPAGRPEGGAPQRVAHTEASPLKRGTAPARWSTRRLLTVPGLSRGRP